MTDNQKLELRTQAQKVLGLYESIIKETALLEAKATALNLSAVDSTDNFGGATGAEMNESVTAMKVVRDQLLFDANPPFENMVKIK